MGKPVPEREAAKLAGERFYWTGKACRNGHLAKRYTANGLCSACSIKNVIAYQKRAPEHPNRIAARVAGETHYETDEPCRNGHVAKRYVSNGRCVECDSGITKRYHASHPGIEARWARERRAKDPAGHRKAAVKWAKNNPDKTKEIRKRMIAKDLEAWRRKWLAGTNNYRTKKAGNGGTFTAQDIDALHEKQGGKCAACFKVRKLEIDHIIAVASGGSSDPSNLQLLCGPCNKSKGKKDAILWAQEHHGRLL